MKIISYYELLKMIKDGNIPKKVNYRISGYLEDYVEYTAQYDRNDFTHYELTNHHREDESIHFYLNENFLESDMFDESILILEKQKKIPEKIEYYDDSIAWVIDDVGQISDVDKVIIDKLNDVIDYLKNKGE